VREYAVLVPVSKWGRDGYKSQTCHFEEGTTEKSV